MPDYTPEVQKLLDEGYTIQDGKLISPPTKYVSYKDTARPQDTQYRTYTQIEYTFDAETGMITGKTERNLYQYGGGSRYHQIKPYDKRIETYYEGGSLKSAREYKTVPIGSKGIEEPRLYLDVDYEKGVDYMADFKTPSMYKTTEPETKPKITGYEQQSFSPVSTAKVGDKNYAVLGEESTAFVKQKQSEQPTPPPKIVELSPEHTKTVTESIGKREATPLEKSQSELASGFKQTINYGGITVTKELVEPETAMKKTEMSLRDDTGLITLTTRTDKGLITKKQPVSYDPNISTGTKPEQISSGRQALEKGIIGVQKRQRGMEERAEGVREWIGSKLPEKYPAMVNLGLGGSIWKESTKEKLTILGSKSYEWTVGLVESGFLAVEKGYVFGRALLTPESQQPAITEMKSSVGKTTTSLGESFNPTTFEGAVNIGGVIGMTYVGGKAIKTSRATKAVQKASLQKVSGEQFYKPVEIKFDLKGDVMLKSYELGELVKPEQFTTSKYKIVTREPTVSVAKQVGTGKGTVTRVTVGGTEYTTVTKGKYTGISKVDSATGKGTIKVLEAKKPISSSVDMLRTKTYDLKTVAKRNIKTEPSVVSLEPTEITAKETIRMPEQIMGEKEGILLRKETKFGKRNDYKPETITKSQDIIELEPSNYLPEITREYKESTGMSELRTAKEGQPEIKGRSITTSKQELVVTTKEPMMEITSYGYEVNLDTFKIRPTEAEIRIGRTYYEFVDYTPKQKSLDITLTDRMAFIKQPTRSITYQKQTIKTGFEYEFVEPPSKAKQLFKSKRGSLGSSVIEEPQLVQIQRPTTSKVNYGTLVVTTPAFSTVSSMKTIPLGIKVTPDYEEPTTKSETIPAPQPMTKPTTKVDYSFYRDTGFVKKAETNIIPEKKSFFYEEPRTETNITIKPTITTIPRKEGLFQPKPELQEGKAPTEYEIKTYTPAKNINENVNRNINETFTPTKNINREVNKNVEITKNVNIQREVTVQTTLQKELALEYTPTPSTTTFFRTTPTPKSPPFTPPPMVLFPQDIRGGDGFLVGVRRFGEWKTLRRTETLNEALRAGKGYTWHTAGASFRITALGMRGREELARTKGIGRQYYKSTKESDVFIEKPEYRIKSFGEKREISLKGVESQKRKRRKKRFMI